MDAIQVIELGKEIVIPEMSIFGMLQFLIVVLLAIFFFAVLIEFCLNLGKDTLIWIFLISGLCGISFFAVKTEDYLKQMTAFNVDVEKWKNEIANPYIESLTSEKKEIVFIKIEAELGARASSYRYTSKTESVERTPVTVSFKDGNNVVTRTEWYETTMELADDEVPYLEYKNLTVNLGHGIIPGIYNAKIHLPKSYRFTEIK
ncbi:hypothetical protein ACFVS2_25825 [Brevibacillus sp. NPDC058079]|uniref:hypothetical protein n=1 Tax=Brevibacillus sp. NPDC058079 TaxID=3346330 RepID=UPI0036E94A9D